MSVRRNLVRAGLLGLAAAGLLQTSPALANTFAFGATSLFSSVTNESVGGGSDQATSQSSSSTSSTANFRAQASADTATSDARRDQTYTWRVPYTITRTVGLVPTPPAPAQLVVPIQTVNFSISFSGAVGVSEFGGYEGAQIFNGISVTSLGGLFSAVTYNGAERNNSDGTTAINGGPTARSYGTSVNFSGAALGEISLAAQIPTDMRVWQDFSSPFAADYSNGSSSWVQSFTDTLEVSFRVRAVSRTSGSISTTAGEAIACAGLNSNLGAFSFSPNCGSGLTVTGSVAASPPTTLVNVPEPTTLVLLGGALTALALAGSRRRPRS
jgi:hypothetical protein